jgi:Lrp/AsnC family transcriptional regulator
MIDETDRAILRILQKDATTPLESLSETLSLSVNTCWRRVRKLEDGGILKSRIAVCDPDKLGLACPMGLVQP